VVARLDVNQFMERLKSVMEIEQALQQCGLSPEELAIWFEIEGHPKFGDATDDYSDLSRHSHAACSASLTSGTTAAQ
jgi:hypothetical protein